MVMDIAQILQEKAGLTPEQSTEVAQVILAHITSKVPSQFQGFLAPLLGGAAAVDADGQPVAAAHESGGLSGLLGAASGLFGNKS